MTDDAPARKRGPKPSAALREAIAEAAISLFAEHGIAATSTRQIAAAAGTTERTLFKHYGSKAGLTNDVVEQLSIHAMRSQSFAHILADEPFTPDSFRAWHREFLLERVGNAEQSPDHYRLLFRELFADRLLATRYAEAWLPNVFGPLTVQLARLRAAGALDSPLSDEAVAGAFFSLNLSYLVARFALLPGRPWQSATDVEAVVTSFAAICGWRA